VQIVDHAQASRRTYEVVIVGAGISGAVLAKVLAGGGRSVLIVDAGDGRWDDFDLFQSYVDRFYRASAKIPNSPFPNNPSAPQPLETDIRKIQPGVPSDVGYFVQEGPEAFQSTYTRRFGGTTLHWFGSCPRMVADDFVMLRRFGVGRDWPIVYDRLTPYYEMAEAEIGVSAEVEDQKYAGIKFSDGYVFPMHRIPPSYLDTWMASGLKGMKEADGVGREIPIEVVSIPQARNSRPNAAYDRGRGYRPSGAVGNPYIGQRCMGNSSCIPICPIQARYSSWKTLQRSLDKDIDILPRALAFRVEADSATGGVSGIRCLVRNSEMPTEQIDVTVRGRVFVLAAHAIENAMLLLASTLANSSAQLGQNLMDHPAILSWGLAPENIGAFRGPGLTSTIPAFRSGGFRILRAGFVFEIGNWGWSWPAQEPNDSVNRFVDNDTLYGRRLRETLKETLPRQIRVDLMTEQLPTRENQVRIDPRYPGPNGVHRPVIRYSIDEYSKRGMVFGRAFARRVFDRLGIRDFTSYNSGDPGYFEIDHVGYTWNGVGHVAGTHIMGDTPAQSVVDHRQKSWDHDNLYIVGCGSFPTLGTSNPTLTMTALNFRTAEFIEQDLKQ
jgi:choline dehydrogenase-like flavoprotein